MNSLETHPLARQMVEDADCAYNDFICDELELIEQDRGELSEEDRAYFQERSVKERGRLWAETTLPSFEQYDVKLWLQTIEDIRQYYVNRAILRYVDESIVTALDSDGLDRWTTTGHRVLDKMEEFESKFNELCHKAYIPVEVPDNLVVFDTPETIEGARLLALAAALEFEVKTGMKRSSRGRATSTIIKEAMLKHGFKLTSRKKANLLKEYEGCLQELGVLQV